MTRPNFLIIGAAKAGTSALCAYMAQHPEVYFSPTKEPAFFAFEGQALRFRGPGDEIVNRVSVTRRDRYEALFRGGRGAIAVGEASTVYLYQPAAAARIYAYEPRMRLVALLRDPVERAHSSYQHLVRDGREPAPTFEEGLAREEARIQDDWEHLWHYTRMGFYAVQLERYLARFQREQLLLLTYDEFEADQLGTLQRVFRFLEVDPTFVPDTLRRYNVSGMPRSKALHALFVRPSVAKQIAKRVLPMSLRRAVYDSVMQRNIVRQHCRVAERTRHALIELFRADIGRLQGLLGRDLSAWTAVASASMRGEPVPQDTAPAPPGGSGTSFA